MGLQRGSSLCSSESGVAGSRRISPHSHSGTLLKGERLHYKSCAWVAAPEQQGAAGRTEVQLSQSRAPSLVPEKQGVLEGD
ncbi:hypothetical protein NDU88_003515 [Pleurodeles waltl]|uniref:Uncharacterized protein n=1 Tax=Pleurodeles waltl TaxID=8319 RepID=A0AAV7TRC6_PLEWA|nr:hypothetical protein NDU88_003515 [Pleurodeles waltl]